MSRYRVIASLMDRVTGKQVDPGQDLPQHLADDPVAVERLRQALCIEPLPAGDTPELEAVGEQPVKASRAAVRRPVRGRRRADG